MDGSPKHARLEHAPARIFVLWHPDYLDGIRIAEAIFAWFRTRDGHGLPVYYRAQADPHRADGLPPEIPDPRSRQVNFVILLAEFRMVRDRAWREWLERLSNPKIPRTVIYPVVLHRSAYKLPGRIRKVNFVRVYEANGRDGEPVEREVGEVLPSLRKNLTEVFARALGHQVLNKGITADFLNWLGSLLIGGGDTEPPKLQIFISHAKRDGTDVARQLRDYIYQETQLSAFFDENDIAFGHDFADALEQALNTGSAAMIAVNSDAYASRPWCRRELQLFGRPRWLKAHRIWATPPVLVLQAMSGGHISAAIPEFGNAPMLRWREGDAALCIDTLLRESVLRTYHAALGGMIAKKLGGGGDTERLFINWTPDPLSLAAVIRKDADTRRKGADPETPLDVVYPGRGMSYIELQSLQERFPNVTLRSFNEARIYPGDS